MLYSSQFHAKTLSVLVRLYYICVWLCHCMCVIVNVHQCDIIKIIMLHS